MTEGQKLSDKQKQLVADYKQTFNSDFGQRVLADIREHSGFEGRIEPTPDDTLATLGFALGRREMFLWIADKLYANPDETVQTEVEVDDAA